MELSNKHLTSFFFILCGIFLFVSHKNDTPVAVPSVVMHAQAMVQSNPVATAPQGKYQYLEITKSCGSNFEGYCFSAYSGPGTNYPEMAELRNGMVLKIKNKVSVNGQIWYQVYFDEWLRHPERVEGNWYISAAAGRVVTGEDSELHESENPVTSKRIIVDLSDHMIYAYGGNDNFLTTKVATGVDTAPTPIGTFTVYKKTPSRYMQGPIPGVSDVAFDLPGTPWNMYFTKDGAVIHGSYWHDRYGTEQSSGCINLPPELAKILYDWADIGTTVTIRD